MKNELLINEAFNRYNRKMYMIYSELNYLKESYSYKDSQLLMEGFWDKMRSAAKGSGVFLGKTTQRDAT